MYPYLPEPHQWNYVTHKLPLDIQRNYNLRLQVIQILVLEHIAIVSLVCKFWEDEICEYMSWCET